MLPKHKEILDGYLADQRRLIPPLSQDMLRRKIFRRASNFNTPMSANDLKEFMRKNGLLDQSDH